MSMPFTGRTTVRLATILALSGATHLPAQHPVTPAEWTAFTQAFDSYADSDRIVGASVALLHDGRVVAHHEHGFADRARSLPITERTIFHYGSITKTLTAIAIMQLRDRGLLTLDDRDHALRSRAASRARFVRVDRQRHPPDAAVAHGRIPESHLAVHGRQELATVRADRLVAARRDDAVPGIALQAWEPLRLLQPRIHLPRAGDRAAQRRPVGELHPEEHPLAAGTHATATSASRRTISRPTGRTTTTRERIRRPGATR